MRSVAAPWLAMPPWSTGPGWDSTSPSSVKSLSQPSAFAAKAATQALPSLAVVLLTLRRLPAAM
eukprot:11388637-Alexandrium_andersonii.AAC.1